MHCPFHRQRDILTARGEACICLGVESVVCFHVDKSIIGNHDHETVARDEGPYILMIKLINCFRIFFQLRCFFGGEEGGETREVHVPCFWAEKQHLFPAGHVASAVVEDEERRFSVLAGGWCARWWGVYVELLGRQGAVLVCLSCCGFYEWVTEQERDEVGEGWGADFW